MEIINPQTQLNGAGPWNTQAYTFTGNMLLDLWGNAASDTVEIIRLLQTSGTNPTTNNQMCCVTAGTEPVPIATKPLKRCNDGVAYDAALNASVNSLTIPAGTYLFRFSGAGFTAKTTRMTAENTGRKACDCDCLPITAATLPAATKTIAPCPIGFPRLWDYDQTVYNTLPAFVAAYKAAMLPVAVTFDGACTFSAQNGTNMLPAALSEAPVVTPNTGALSVCPAVYPVLFQTVSYANLPALKAAVESFYAVQTSYDAATCTFTKVGGTGTLPASIAIDSGCGFYLSGGTVTNNGGVAQFRKVQIDPALLPRAGFAEFNDNSGALVSLLRLTSGTQCGITFNVVVSDNSGSLVGYGAQL